jgi:hypothetical protein
MKKNNIRSSLFGYLALASGSIWFGAYLARLLTTYKMFEETEPILKNFLNSTNLPAIVEVMSPLIILTSITYLIMIISFTVFLFTSDFKLKQNGWLFIIAAIIYITLPFEAILLMNDYKLIILFINEQFGSEKVIELITDRQYRLSSFPIIQILSYLSVPYLLIFKPFTLKIKDED